MIMSISLAATALTMQAAPDWRTLADNEQAQIMWDAASVSRWRGLVAVSVRITPRPLRTGENAYAVAQVELHCVTNQSRVARTQNYSTNGAAGASDESTLPFSEIPAGSFIESLRGHVCLMR